MRFFVPVLLLLVSVFGLLVLLEDTLFRRSSLVLLRLRLGVLGDINCRLLLVVVAGLLGVVVVLDDDFVFVFVFGNPSLSVGTSMNISS